MILCELSLHDSSTLLYVLVEQQISNLSSRIDILQTQLAVSQSSQPNVTISNQCNENSHNNQPPRSFYNGRNKFINKNAGPTNVYKHPNRNYKSDANQKTSQPDNWRSPKTPHPTSQQTEEQNVPKVIPKHKQPYEIDLT